MSNQEWLGLGIWGRREEARKSWSYVTSDVVVYFADFFPGQFERNSLCGIEWISKYQRGDIWLEYHGVLDRQRPAKFHAIVEVVPGPSPGFQVEVHDIGPTDRKSMLVDVTQLVQLPQGIIPIGCPSFVRLKVFDDGDGIAGHVPHQFPESIFRTAGLVGMDREHDIPGRTGIPKQCELPGELIKSRAERIDRVGETQNNVHIDAMRFTPNDMALIHQIVMLRDCIWLGPTVLNNKGIKFLEVFVRPAYFRSKITDPAAVPQKGIASHGFTLPSTL